MKRRKRHKLLMFHKMILDLCPQYISDLLHPLVAHINPYHRRRPLKRDVTTCKTELYRNSFIPSTTAEWNFLPISVQQSTSLSVFKRSLSLSDSKVPAYYYESITILFYVCSHRGDIRQKQKHIIIIYTNFPTGL